MGKRRNRKQRHNNAAATAERDLYISEQKIPPHAYTGPRREPAAYGSAYRNPATPSAVATGSAVNVPSAAAGDAYSNAYVSPAATTPYKKWCDHDAHAPVISIALGDEGRPVTLHAAAKSDLENAHEAALIVMCLDGKLEQTVIDTPEGYESLHAHVLSLPPVITIPWTDRAAPALAFSFWAELLRLMPIGKIVFVCFGGHGRSGTALACCIVAHFGCTARYAINLVRQKHCESAIETAVQEQYIEDVADYVAANGGGSRAALKSLPRLVI